MREPKKVRTIAELIKSCRMLREHNEKLKGRNSELEARLEISPDHDVDGIEARDETIKLLDDRIAELEAELTIKLLKDRIEELEARLEFKQKNTDALIARWEPYIEQLEAALREIVLYAKPKYRSTRDKLVRDGVCLSGGLLHYESMPHVIHAGKKVLLREGE